MGTVHQERFAVFIVKMYVNLGRKSLPKGRAEFYVKLHEVLGASHVTIQEMWLC